MQGVADRVGEAMIKRIAPYQPSKEKVVFFFEGISLVKPGRTKLSNEQIGKRARCLNKAVRAVYSGAPWRRIGNLTPRKLIARNMGRPAFWFSARVAEYLSGMA